MSLRAGAIGHTGAGNFGHGLHVCYGDVPGIDLVAVADPDETGRERARAETGATACYADYREMLDRERLDVVSVCPRWVDRREAMVTACLEAGCHIYSEKPFAMTLASADRMIALAEEKGLKIAVAHQGVYLPQVATVRSWIREGRIGRVLAYEATGKQDHRGGGEDMLVLGTHLFNMMRFFEGEAAWVSARITENGREIGRGDGRNAHEPIGLIAGDRVECFYAFRSGAVGTFVSRKRERRDNCYGLVVRGEDGAIAVSGNASEVRVTDDPDAAPWEDRSRWSTPDIGISPLTDGNRLAVADLLHGVATGDDPISSAADARAALEMIHGAYASQVSGARATFPLAVRDHPLDEGPA